MTEIVEIIISVIIPVIIAIALFMLYFLPFIVAMSRNHNNETPIFMVNLFFGWTFVGWVACLAWACSNDVYTEENISEDSET